MTEKTTKEKILDAALTLFSTRGFDSVSVDEIAKTVGIKAPSLYKHYKSKADIFEAILAEMKKRYETKTESMAMHLESAENDLDMFSKSSADLPAKLLRELFLYSLHDDYVSKFRKLLTIEQFENPSLAALYSERYFKRILSYHEKLFVLLSEKGIIKKTDCRITALQYISPVLVLLSECDRHPEKEEEALKLLDDHVKTFNEFYREEEKS